MSSWAGGLFEPIWSRNFAGIFESDVAAAWAGIRCDRVSGRQLAHSSTRASGADLSRVDV